ncbi:MAG: type II toxin-antitoxin system VapC family toxin [Chloroflexi bacterium]|nr:type II toxin-antitoxin system VapC family toxin [Chloroflexota bacterium]
MNVVDSSGWLEYFADGPNAAFFASPIREVDDLLVPALNLYEVYRRLYRQRGEAGAALAVGIMRQATVVSLDAAIALRAARVSLERRLAMADSVMLATAEELGATFWTQDSDFEAIPGVQYVPARS